MAVKNNTTIGFIGMGKMAQAIWTGLKNAQLFKHDQAAFFDISANSSNLQEQFNIKYLKLSELFKFADILIFCVKPQNINNLLLDFPKINLEKKLLISILAGTAINTFETYLGTQIQMVRVMPNTPALLQKGMSALAFNANVTPEHQELAKQIFQSCGEIELVDENMLNIVTGISGSGPAFLYRLAEIIAQTGVQNGLEYPKSLKLIAQTMVGAGTMLLQSNKTATELIQDVSSPNGTTVAGLAAFDKTKIDTDLPKVIEATINRACELENKKNA
jgi:pyrroline-5-carboxylate reductase